MKKVNEGFEAIGLRPRGTIFRNLNEAELVEAALLNGEGTFADTGALTIDTGAFTGRSPEDKFFVLDDLTRESVWWGGDFNHHVEPEVFDRMLDKMTAWLSAKDLYVADLFACADTRYRISITAITTQAFHNLFARNMFICPSADDLAAFTPGYTIICAPDFEAEPISDGVPHKNFALINLTRKIILIGGTGYTGEIKKGIFSVLNFLLPHQHKVLSMHCSANIGKKGDTAVFFGLSGTGKTTLSADPDRNLIGDDEHGWSDTGVFNFEGGCYAKVIRLSAEQEPEIWNAVKFGSIVENTRFFPGTRTVNYEDTSVTENTRVSYPLHYIPNAVEPSLGGIPKNIFFLASDSFGVFPPISRLNPGQAMFHFISGYTAKVAGTEMGVKEPKPTFSACFGAPFMPLHPAKYAELLGAKMKEHDVKVWLVNTGWSGGKYGTGKRMKLAYTRAMVTAALNGDLDHVNYHEHPVFGFRIPESCPGVPSEILDTRNTWADKDAYDAQADELAAMFVKNFEKFRANSDQEIRNGAPRIREEAAGV